MAKRTWRKKTFEISSNELKGEYIKSIIFSEKGSDLNEEKDDTTLFINKCVLMTGPNIIIIAAVKYAGLR